MQTQNKLVITTNNIVLIGSVEVVDYGIIIDKPHSITLTPEGYILQPFLQKFTGQIWNNIELKDKDILTTGDIDMTNPILEEYLKKISGIEIENKQIII